MEKSHYGSSKIFKGYENPFLPPCPVIYPTYTSFCLKSLNNAIDFHPVEKWPCKNTWYRDVKSTHIRNWRILDLPYKKPKCCSDIYNIILDRQKLKKLQKFGLTKEIRTIISELEAEEVKKCEPEENIEGEVVDEQKITYFPECYEVPECSSDEEDENYEVRTSDSVNESSGCSNLASGKRKKNQKVGKKDLKIIFQRNELVCSEKVAEELKKHKLGQNFQLKLKKVF